MLQKTLNNSFIRSAKNFFGKLHFFNSLILVLFVTTAAFASDNGYSLIEDTATLPLLSPTLAKRKVAKIKLDNGLEAYLISDPETQESAASLTVEVGSWNDPEEYPGTAHFLEHMLFMGTKAYPDEKEYSQYGQDNGALINAFTADDRTAYLFSINNNAFEGMLERFSHFFIDPLLSTSCIERELHAVDQEHSKNIENDQWRRLMILKETGNPNHPNAKFSCGNAGTLSGIPQEALKKWYQSHYSAQIMHLVVLSNLPLEKLITLTKENFSSVPSFTPQKTRLDMPLTSSKQRGHINYIAPIKDLRSLVLTWEVPTSFVTDLETHPTELIAFALAHQGEGSLLQSLKEENLAEDLNVEGERLGKKEMLFEITIDLTQQGLSQVDIVLERVFQAIARLKATGIPPHLFQEIQTLATLNYQYQSREKAFRFINMHAFNVLNEEISSYPEKSFIPTSYNPAAISAFIEQLSPQNCLFALIADPELSEVPMTTKERWMGAEYTLKEIPKAKLLSWSEVNPHAAIQLPISNPYIPENLHIKKQPLNTPSYKKPALLYQQNDGKIYFAADSKYNIPETALIFDLKSPLIDGSANKHMLLDLFLLAFYDHIAANRSFATQAGFALSTANDDLALRIALSGYSDKAPLLFTELFNQLKTFTLTAEKFTCYKEELQTRYENSSKTLPLKQALNHIANLITNDQPLAEEKLFHLNEITFEEFEIYSKELFSKAFVNGTIYGNLTQTEALELWNQVKTLLAAEAYPPQEHTKKEVIFLPENEGPHMIHHTTDRQGCGVILLIDQDTFTLENRAAQELLSTALHEGFFDTLRTKQQTAYIAQSWDSELEHHLFQYFAVQSSTHSPQELLARFELFLEDFMRNFETNLSKERFETIRASTITQLERAPENLLSMAGLLHHLAFDYEAEFDRKQKRIEAHKTLSYEKVKKLANQWLSRGNHKRLALLVEGSPCSESPFRYQVVSKENLSKKSTYVAWK